LWIICATRERGSDTLVNEALHITPSLTIPADELRFRFSRSSGPGGQHVNRSATRVELLFDVVHSPSLTDEQRDRIRYRLAPYIDAKGVLHLTAESSRSQWHNRREVVARFQQLLQDALRPQKPRRLTRPSAAARRERLENKRRRSAIKRLRRRVAPDQG